MKLIRYELNGRICQGRIVDGRAYAVDAAAGFPGHAMGEIRLLPPVQPTKVVAIGLNYRDHAEEVGLPIPEEPLLFLKPPSSVIGPGDTIVMPPQSRRVDYEAELAIAIGKTASKVTARDSRDYILGYTCLNDVTARDLQGKDGQWTRAKGFDTFCPIGPWVETEIDPLDLKIELYLNEERKQESRTSMLIFNPYLLVEFISGVMTLFPGDVIATGTTSGIGPMKSGDTVEVRIEGIGSLTNRVEQGEP
jgi:2-keto-4-pentenoate hydratase/2-oxohepta-3-ene-1,7-dioic acid hydratase in catechol pathway